MVEKDLFVLKEEVLQYLKVNNNFKFKKAPMKWWLESSPFNKDCLKQVNKDSIHYIHITELDTLYDEFYHSEFELSFREWVKNKMDGKA